MLISKYNIWFKPVGVCLAVLTSISLASAGDMTDNAQPLPDTEYEASLLKDSSLYPSVGLRKQVSQTCYCSGAYFSITGGYALGSQGQLIKGDPVASATGVSAVVQPAIINPGGLNESIPQITMSGKQLTGSIAAGYKFGNFRVEMSGEYRRHNSWGGFLSGGGVVLPVSAKTQQYGALMSAFYDVEIPGIPIQPYVGLGAGLTLSKTQYNVDYTAGGTTTSATINFSKGMSFTGAAMAGIAMNIGDNITLDLGYRFTNTLGGRATYDGQTNGAAINAATGLNVVNISGMALGDVNGTTYKETLDYPSITSHEVRAGVRYRF
uniref:Porin opacity type domain-containing protein n=1 Tax=OCS116 cluster bacterium TaxID=2030921 RepID=A0A2A4Z4X9_9PROT